MLPLHNWVREGNEKARLAFLRNLGDPCTFDYPLDDETEDSYKSLADDMAFEVVSTLVAYSKGRERAGKDGKPYYFYPYGKAAATSTNAFKKVPDAFFASSLSTMYIFAARDNKTWSTTVLSKFAHPVSGLWPWKTVKRHIVFGSRFRLNRESLFRAYENDGGTYHGPEPSDESVVRTNKPKTRKEKQKMAAEMSSDDSDTVDEDFI